MKNFPFSLVLVLLISSLSFSQWSQQNFSDFKYIYCMDFKDDLGILGGWGPASVPIFAGRAYYSTDGGANWSASQLPDSVRTIQDVQIINRNLIYASGTRLSTSSPWGMDAIFLQSTDGGQHWQEKGNLPDSVFALCKMQFLDADNGFILAYVDEGIDGIMKTTDGGLTWSWSFPYEQNVKLHSLNFYDSMRGAATGYTTAIYPQRGLLLFTTNGGASWNRFAPVEVADMKHVKYISSEKIVVLAEHPENGGMVIVSTDGGTGWGPKKYISAPMTFGGADGGPDGIMIVYGVLAPTGSSTPFVYLSSDMGTSWMESTLSPLTNVDLFESKVISNSEWYISGHYFGQSGILLHTINSGGMPVELSSFTAMQTNASVELRWTTASETNNRGFEIQRRTGTTDFTTIGFISGYGTTTEAHNYSFTDTPENTDEILIYRLKIIDLDGSFEYSAEESLNFKSLSADEESVPLEYSLSQNYPNPFNPVTVINYKVKTDGLVQIKISNILGQEIKTIVNQFKEAGTYTVNFDGSGLPSGMYIYTISVNDFTESKKMILNK